MNLKDLQISKATNEATMTSLKKGMIPTLATVNAYLADKFKKSAAGYPIFRPIFSAKYKVSDPISYNLMMNQIKSDLDDLYDADNQNNNEILSMFSYYDVEKKKIDSKINSIQNRLDNLLVGLNREQSKEGIFDNFDDFTKIEFIENQSRALPCTNAFVDLLTKSVSNETLTNNSKVALNDATSKVTVGTPNISNATLSDVVNCLKDSTNETWVQQVITDNSNGVQIRLSVELPTEQNVTTIKFTLQSPRHSTIKLSITDQNKATRTFKEITTTDLAEWNIKSSKVKVLTFDIGKSEPDAIDGVNFQYYIGAKNISVYNDVHDSESIFVSKPFPISKPFNYAYLETEQVLPPDTQIKYYTGIDRDNNFITWKRIYDKEVNDLSLLTPVVDNNINEAYTTDYGMPYGTNGFKLAHLDHTPVDNTAKLFLGINMWEKKTIDVPDINIFALKDVVNTSNITFIKMDKLKFNQVKNTAELYTTYAYCEKPVAIDSIVVSDKTTAQITVNVNGVKIEEISGHRTLRLSAGWNKIEILSITTSDDIVLTLNAYFGDVADIVRAKKDAIKEIPMYDLLYNFHQQTFDYYAIDGNDVILNFDPKSVNLECFIEYMYIHSPGMFDGMNLRFMAVLSSNSADVTPKLKNYKITTI